MSPQKASDLVARERDPKVKAMLIHRLFGDDHGAPFSVTQCRALLEEEVIADDPDLARYAAGLLVTIWPWSGQPRWTPPRNANHSVKLLLLSLGIRRRAPRKGGVLDAFFRDKMSIAVPVPWRKAL